MMKERFCKQTGCVPQSVVIRSASISVSPTRLHFTLMEIATIEEEDTVDTRCGSCGDSCCTDSCYT